MKYISHKVLYTLLPSKLQQLPDTELDNWIIQCVRQINAHPLYEKKLCMTKVINGVAELPDDFIKAYGVFYNSRTPNDEEFNSLLGCLCDDDTWNDCIPDTMVSQSDTTTTMATSEISADVPLTIQDRYKLLKIATTDSEGTVTTKYVLKGVLIDSYVSSPYHNNCWTPLYVSDKLFTQCYMEKRSPCLIQDLCNYRYSFDKCGHLMTSMPDGWVKIIYTGRPVDVNGDFLIPDNMDYLNVLRDGVLMYYWEERRTDNREGSLSNHREYEQKFYNGVAALRGSSLLPKGIAGDKALRNIIYDNVSLANNYALTGNGGWTGGPLFKHMR